jgi:hypothetical protein
MMIVVTAKYGRSDMKLESDSNKQVAKSSSKNKKSTVLPSDRIILDTLYRHYGRPKNIIKEKVKMFTGYSTPAGWKMEDWKMGEYQLGRVNIYIRSKDHDKYLFGGSPTIQEEGVGSWFIGVSETHIKVWIKDKVDAILEIDDLS